MVEAVAHAPEPRFHHQRGLQTVAGTHPAEDERLLDVLDVHQPLVRAGRLLRAVGEEVAHPVFGQVQHDGRRGRRSPHRADPVVGDVVAAQVGDAKRFREASREFVAADDGAQDVVARAAPHFGQGDRRRNNRRPGLHERGRNEVVDLSGVRSHGTGEHGIEERRLLARPQDARGVLGPAAGLRQRVVARQLRRNQVAARDDRRQRVQNVPARQLPEVFRDRRGSSARDVLRQSGGDRRAVGSRRLRGLSQRGSSDRHGGSRGGGQHEEARDGIAPAHSSFAIMWGRHAFSSRSPCSRAARVT